MILKVDFSIRKFNFKIKPKAGFVKNGWDPRSHGWVSDMSPTGFLITLYLLLLTWILLQTRHHFVRITRGWVVPPDVFIVCILVYTVWFLWVIHQPMWWSTQLVLLMGPWVVMGFFHQPRETFFLSTQESAPVTSVRWRSSDPDRISKMQTMYVMSLFRDESCTDRLGYLLVQNDRITDVENEQVILHQSLQVLLDGSRDVFRTERVWTGPITLFGETRLGPRIPLIYPTRLTCGSGKYADVGGDVVEGGGTLTLWLE